MPGHSNGVGSRKTVLSALSDVMWYQTPPHRWDYSQGKHRAFGLIEDGNGNLLCNNIRAD